MINAQKEANVAAINAQREANVSFIHLETTIKEKIAEQKRQLIDNEMILSRQKG